MARHLHIANFIGFLLGPIVALALFYLNKPWAKWVSIVMLMAIVLAYAIVRPAFIREGYHGFMHLSMVNAVSRQMPPEDPFFAGTSLKYPYMAHVMLAKLSPMLVIPAMDLLAYIDIVMFFLTLLTLAATAKILGASNRGIAWGVLFAGLGVNVVLGSPIGLVLFKVAPIVGAESRISPFDKFANPNQNQYGLAGYAIWLMCLLMAVRGDRRTALWALISLPAAAIGILFYPMSAAVFAISMASAWFAWLLSKEKKTLGLRLLLMSVVLLVAVAPSVQYALSVTSGKSALASFTPEPIGRFMVTKICKLIMFLAFPVVLIAFARERLRQMWNEQRFALTTIGASAIALSLLYVFVRFPANCDYKWLIFICMPIGLICGELASAASLPARSIWAKGVVWASFALVLMGPIRGVWMNLTSPQEIPLVQESGWLYPSDPTWNALCKAIREKTPDTAVIVSQNSVFAPLANRSLFVAMEQVCRDRYFNGWGQPEWSLLEEVIGHEKFDVDRRRDLVQQMLAPTWGRPALDVFRDFDRAVAGRPIFVIAETKEAADKLRGTPSLEVWTYPGSTEPGRSPDAPVVFTRIATSK